MVAAKVHRSRGLRAVGGFTLIELMAVVVVIAVLAAIALPAYMEQVRKSRRADAIALLSGVSQAQERWRANSPTYSPNLGSGGLVMTSAATAVTTAGTVSSSQFDGPSGYYRVSVSTNSAGTPPANLSSYTAVATAIGAQASDSKCTSLTLQMTAGTLSYTATPAANANLCWSR